MTEELDLWEYLIVSVSTIRKGHLQQRLNDLGSIGWQVVGFAQSDKTIGLNSLEVVLKRRKLDEPTATVEKVRIRERTVMNTGPGRSDFQTEAARSITETFLAGPTDPNEEEAADHGSEEVGDSILDNFLRGGGSSGSDGTFG